jgi:hypothetical protein
VWCPGVAGRQGHKTCAGRLARLIECAIAITPPTAYQLTIRLIQRAIEQPSATVQAGRSGAARRLGSDRRRQIE